VYLSIDWRTKRGPSVIERPGVNASRENAFDRPSTVKRKWNLQPMRNEPQSYVSSVASMTYATCEGPSFFA
jgi:hypothetical protein